MVLTALLASAIISPSDPSAVMLDRVFKKGEKAEYKVVSTLQVERRQLGLNTFIPFDYDINYNFSYVVQDMKNDGFAVIRYKRPTITEIEGETFDSPPKKEVTKTNWDVLLTVSPINEITDMKDMTKPAPKKGSGGLRYFMPYGELAPQINIGTLTSEIQRLSLFVGSLDSSLDFAPKLPYSETKVGDTWKQTVGYSPQKLKGADGKNAMQRLDYTFTYKGVVQAGSRKVHRVTAVLNLDTNAADWVNELVGGAERSGLKEIRLKLDANIDYDLDLNTRKTLKAVATSTGSTAILLNRGPQEPVQEERIKGRTVMTLVK